MDKNIELSAEVNELLEDNEITLDRVELQGQEYMVELVTYSPADGEVTISFSCDGTEADFINKFNEYARNFDVDEYVEMYIPIRGQRGVPNSISALVKDAEWVKETLESVGNKLNNLEIELDEDMSLGRLFKEGVNERFRGWLLFSVYSFLV